MSPAGLPRTIAGVFSAAALIACIAGSNACSSEGAAARTPPAPPGGGKKGPLAYPVEVKPVASRDVQYELSAVGSVDAYERVQITARVAGVIERVRLDEGQQVKRGQTLAEIEPRRFQVAVRAAEASLARARASKADAEAGLKRREDALTKSPGLIPAEELETFRTKLNIAEAELLSAQATHDQASLNLYAAFVRAPVSGTIETRSVQTGQYAQPGTVLGTLVRRDPLLLRFQVPESDASRLSDGTKVHFTVRGAVQRYDATITHVGALADAASRMVQVTAEVDPTQREALRPGAFAEVSAPVGGGGQAPVVPEAAVRPSEKGFLVYVIEGDVAKERVVTLGMHTLDGQVEVREGLRPGEQLVVRGAEGLHDGTKVRIEQGGESKPKPGRAP